MKNVRSARNAVSLNNGSRSVIPSIRGRLQLTVCISLLLLCASCSTLTAISVGRTGEWANAESRDIDISYNGRYVAFSSSASNLIPTCTPVFHEVVYIRDTYENTLRPLWSNQAEGCGRAHSPSISSADDGSRDTHDFRVAFVSKFSFQSTHYNTGRDRVFVQSTDPSGFLSPHFSEHCVPNGNGPNLPLEVANGPCTEPDISRGGSTLVYSSTASNLLSSGGSTNSDIYITGAQISPYAYPYTINTVDLVSRSISGGASNGHSRSPSVSGSGRYVAFASTATDLIANDFNDVQDIFVRDMETQATTRVSNGLGWQQANGDSSDPVISADGRYVTFTSRASNLRPEDPYGEPDVYVYDRILATTELVSVDLPGPVRLYQAGKASISRNGRFISFHSYGPQVSHDTNSLVDVFMRDIEKGITKRISEGTYAEQGSGGSHSGTMSDDGRYVAFLSSAEDLYSGDNGFTDVYMKAAIEPTVDSISHGFLHRGDTTSVTITGSYFMPGSVPVIDHTTISNVVIVDENTITADVTVDDVVVYDTYDVSVYLYASGPAASRGSSAGVCSDCVSLF